MPFHPNVPFWSPWKHQKTKCFLMFANQMFSDVCKPNVFWCLQGNQKGNIAKKRVKRHGVIINCGINCSEVLINLFVTNVLILYSQKTLENLLFSDVFKGGYKMGTLARARLIGRGMGVKNEGLMNSEIITLKKKSGSSHNN